MPTPRRPDRHHPEGGRKARRAYAARPYLPARDGAFYGMLWAAGMTAVSGGASATGVLAGALVWAVLLLAAWSLSRWLRRQEDFDNPAVDTMASPTAAAFLFCILPVLAGLGAFLGTGGRLWWEPLTAAGLAGMAGAAASAFLERAFRAGSVFAGIALLGAIGRPGPAWETAVLAGLSAIAYFSVTAAQERAFRHMPDGPFPPAQRLGGDARAGLLLLGLGLALAWIWTPPLKPRAVQILPAMDFRIWNPGERGGGIDLHFFGKPPLDASGSPQTVASSESRLLERMLGTGSGGGVLGMLLAGGVLLLLYLAWRMRRKAANRLALEKRQETLRGPGVQPRARPAPTAAPEDAREAVIYWYNRLRAELVFFGIPRQEALTPSEYAHALSRHPSAGAAPIPELTELFHRAEYSLHPIGDDDRRRAEAQYQDTIARVVLKP